MREPDRVFRLSCQIISAFDLKFTNMNFLLFSSPESMLINNASIFDLEVREIEDTLLAVVFAQRVNLHIQILVSCSKWLLFDILDGLLLLISVQNVIL